MHHVFVGFGGNVGDSVRICREAVAALQAHPRIDVRKVSSLYSTKPVGLVEQPWFVNGALQGETDLEPEELLEVLLQLEGEFGRIRTVHWGPRTLDLDILFFEDRTLDRPELTLPHPRLHERLFVLLPLEEIAPDWMHPVSKRSVRDLLARLSAQDHDQEVHRLEDV